MSKQTAHTNITAKNRNIILKSLLLGLSLIPAGIGILSANDMLQNEKSTIHHDKSQHKLIGTTDSEMFDEIIEVVSSEAHQPTVRHSSENPTHRRNTLAKGVSAVSKFGKNNKNSFKRHSTPQESDNNVERRENPAIRANRELEPGVYVSYYKSNETSDIIGFENRVIVENDEDDDCGSRQYLCGLGYKKKKKKSQNYPTIQSSQSPIMESEEDTEPKEITTPKAVGAEHQDNDQIIQHRKKDIITKNQSPLTRLFHNKDKYSLYFSYVNNYNKLNKVQNKSYQTSKQFKDLRNPTIQESTSNLKNPTIQESMSRLDEYESLSSPSISKNEVSRMNMENVRELTNRPILKYNPQSPRDDDTKYDTSGETFKPSFTSLENGPSVVYDQNRMNNGTYLDESKNHHIEGTPQNRDDDSEFDTASSSSIDSRYVSQNFEEYCNDHGSKIGKGYRKNHAKTEADDLSFDSLKLYGSFTDLSVGDVEEFNSHIDDFMPGVNNISTAKRPNHEKNNSESKSILDDDNSFENNDVVSLNTSNPNLKDRKMDTDTEVKDKVIFAEDIKDLTSNFKAPLAQIEDI